MLTPRLIGNTERAQVAKAVEPSVPIGSIDDWFASLDAASGQLIAANARAALTWFTSQGFQAGRTRAGIWIGVTSRARKLAYPFFFSDQTIWTDLYHLQAHAPFVEEAPRREFLQRLRSLANAGVRGENPQGLPSVTWSALARDEVWLPFRQIALEIKLALEIGDVGSLASNET